MLNRTEVHGSNAQNKYLGTDFPFSKKMFKGSVGVSNVVNFEHIIDILTE